MKNILRLSMLAMAFGFIFIAADTANAQWGRNREARREYRRDVREARRDYRRDIRRGENRRDARREYRSERRDARQDYRRSTGRVSNNSRWYNGRGRINGRGYYNRGYVRSGRAYSKPVRGYWRNGRFIRIY